MNLENISIKNFKKIKQADVSISKITVLIGGNDSGKSSFIQAVHFGLSAANVYANSGKKAFPQESLQYCPTYPFYKLANNSQYQNQSNFYWCTLRFRGIDDVSLEHSFKIYRARNESNVGFESIKSIPSISRDLADSTKLYSIYVNGVSGITSKEPLVSKGVLKRGAASGDSNVYLRNIIYYIFQEKLNLKLISLMREVFPFFTIECKFDSENDIYLEILISVAKGGIPTVPIELCATGVLQILQIFSYATLFKPSLILLDEPDSHIHSDRQIILCSSLEKLVNTTSTKIILTTHSKNVIAALSKSAKFYSFKEGRSSEVTEEKDWLSIAAEMGITSSLDGLNGGILKYVILTEDTKIENLKLLLKSNGFELDACLFSSYSSSSQLSYAIMLARFLSERFKKIKCVIHRDSDFMLPEEKTELIKFYSNGNVNIKIFITEYSDLEGYFCTPNVLSEMYPEASNEVHEIINYVAIENNNDLVSSYAMKRQDTCIVLKKVLDPSMYGKSISASTIVPLPEEQRMGKTMLRKIKEKIRSKNYTAIKYEANGLQSLRRPEIEALLK
jgi:AAA15 family ATPase/GTPase